MSNTPQPEPIPRLVRDRLIFIGLGALAGVALHVLTEIWAHSAWPSAVFLALSVFVSVFSIVLLALIGPLQIGKAMIAAGGVATLTAGLLSVAGQRYVVPIDVLDSGPAAALALLMVFLMVPFVTLWFRDREGWRDYALLFEVSWSVVMRYALAWCFVGVFWILIFLSDALLDLVGISLLEYLFDVELLTAILSGAVLGLGLSVVYELRRTLSPFLVLRLLRLLVPLVLAVVTLFILALPLRGLSELFGGVSSAATLMAASMVSITLVSLAVDRTDALMVSTRGLVLATRVLAIVQPILAVLAVWAIVLRVQQYGWTPDRVLAATFAILLLCYGLGYCISSLSGPTWTQRLRQVNVWLALVSIGVLATWMTPLFDATRMSANSQVSRFAEGRLSADQLAYWSMQHDWGKAGQQGLENLAAMTDHPDHDKVALRVETVREELDEFQFEQRVTDQTKPEELARLVSVMPVLPEGETLSVQDLSELPEYRRAQWLEACERSEENGAPGCVMVLAQFLPVEARQGMFLFRTDTGKTRAHSVIFQDDSVVAKDAYDPIAQNWPNMPADVLTQVQSGAFVLQPRGGLGLHVGGKVLEALP